MLSYFCRDDEVGMSEPTRNYEKKKYIYIYIYIINNEHLEMYQ